MSVGGFPGRFSCVFLFSALATVAVFSNAAAGKSELKEVFKKNVVKAENGDVVVSNFPELLRNVKKYRWEWRYKISDTDVQRKIDEGIPVYCWIWISQEYYETLKERTQKRKEYGNVKEWTKSKDLRDIKLHRIDRKEMSRRWCVIDGYNKTSGEFRMCKANVRNYLPYIDYVESSLVWITEKEFRYFLGSVCTARF